MFFGGLFEPSKRDLARRLLLQRSANADGGVASGVRGFIFHFWTIRSGTIELRESSIIGKKKPFKLDFLPQLYPQPSSLRTSIPFLRTPDTLHTSPQLPHTLLPLLALHAIEHDPSPSLQIRDPVPDQHRPERNTRIHGSLPLGALGVDVPVAEISDRARVHAALLPLELGDELHGADFGSAADGAGGEDAAEGVEAGVAGTQDAADLADQVLHVAELLDGHEAVDAGGAGVADAVDVVAGQVDEHDVFGAVLDGGAQACGQRVVFGDRLPPRNGPGDGVRDDAPVVRLGEQFWGGADQVEGGAVDVEEIGGRVDGSEVAVDVERVDGGGTREALGRNGLDDVALVDVVFECAHVAFVSGLADVGGVLLVGYDWRLVGEGVIRAYERVDGVVEGFAGAAVGGRDGVGVGGRGRNV